MATAIRIVTAITEVLQHEGLSKGNLSETTAIQATMLQTIYSVCRMESNIIELAEMNKLIDAVYLARFDKTKQVSAENMGVTTAILKIREEINKIYNN